MAHKLLALTMLAFEKCCVAKETDDTTLPLIEDLSNKPVELILAAQRKKAIFAPLFERLFGAMKSIPKFCSDPKTQLESCIQMLVLGSNLKSLKLESASEKAFEVFGAGKDVQILVAKICALKMPKRIFFVENVEFDQLNLESLFSRAQIHCAKQLSKNLEKDKLASLLPYLLSALTTDNKKVRKTMLNCFEEVLGQASKKLKAAAFLPLLQHMVDHKFEIMSNVSNLPDVMGQFSSLETNETVLNNLLTLIIACESAQVFSQVTFHSF